MTNQINQLHEICNNLISEVDKFPKDKREDKVFDEWSLKDVVSHINGWNLMRIQELKDFLSNTPIQKISDFNALNLIFLAERKNFSWEELYKEFCTSLQDLVISFKNLPPDSWDKPIWKGSGMTAKKWLKIDSEHLQNEHLTQLKDYNSLYLHNLNTPLEGL